MERSEAVEKGLEFYNTGRPCKRNHVSDRRTDSAACEECHKERSKKEYHEKIRSNPEAMRRHSERIRDLRRKQSAELLAEKMQRKRTIAKISDGLRREYDGDLGR